MAVECLCSGGVICGARTLPFNDAAVHSAATAATGSPHSSLTSSIERCEHKACSDKHPRNHWRNGGLLREPTVCSSPTPVSATCNHQQSVRTRPSLPHASNGRLRRGLGTCQLAVGQPPATLVHRRRVCRHKQPTHQNGSLNPKKEGGLLRTYDQSSARLAAPGLAGSEGRRSAAAGGQSRCGSRRAVCAS